MWMLPLVRFNFDGTIYQCRGPGSGGAGVGLPKMTYTGRLCPIGEPFLSFMQLCNRVEISQVEKDKRVGQKLFLLVI